MEAERCKNGHVRTEENTRWHKDTSRNRVRKRCTDCKAESDRKRRPDGPNAAERSRQATDFLHEDIEDLLSHGATYSEILERGGYSSWNVMYMSLKRRGRFDLIDALREKKAIALGRPTNSIIPAAGMKAKRQAGSARAAYVRGV